MPWYRYDGNVVTNDKTTTIRVQDINLIARNVSVGGSVELSTGQLDVLDDRHVFTSVSAPVDPVEPLAEPKYLLINRDGDFVDTNGSVAPGRRHPTVAKTGAYTATNADHTIRCDASGADFTVTLPAASGRGGREFFIVNLGSTGTVSVARSGSDTINGSATAVQLTETYKYLRVESNGTNGWIITGQN